MSEFCGLNVPVERNISSNEITSQNVEIAKSGLLEQPGYLQMQWYRAIKLREAVLGPNANLEKIWRSKK